MNITKSLFFTWLLLVAYGSEPLSGFQLSGSDDQRPPINYVNATAYHVRPDTHNNESGYFSLSVGQDGNIHIGTCAYGENAYLVEFDPATERQRIVIDTNKVCDLDAKGYAAQAKIHTRNFVGPSGVVYVGSKQGYRLDESDKSEYPGGYFMSYDPRNGRTINHGMPKAEQGIADVAVDEARRLSYIVTCENQHWMLGNLDDNTYRELGPMLTPYAMTLIAANGWAYSITSDFQLASYDPDNDRVRVRPILVDGQKWSRANQNSIPTWVLTSDRRSAYLILMNEPELIEIPLVDAGATVNAESHGTLLAGSNPDSRCGMDLGADGNVYAVIRVDNESGFGKGYLHHLVRFNPESKQKEDLGVLKVANPDFFDWEKTDAQGNKPAWTHGYHRLPDGSLTPLHAHMALKVAQDNTIYITVLYPFTLLRIDQFKTREPDTPATTYLNWIEQAIGETENEIERFTRVGEQVAERHIRGGLIGFPFLTQALCQDLLGRSGGLVHIGFSRPWKMDRTEEEQKNDVALVGYETDPGPQDLEQLEKLKQRGVMIVGFGPSQLKSLDPIREISDEWFDTRLEADGMVVQLDDQQIRTGNGHAMVNAIQGATLIAETISALLRQTGKMPTIWKGYAYADGRAWGDRYFRKKQFHDDFEIQPIEPGVLGRRFLTQIRYPVRRIKSQYLELASTARALKQELDRGNPVYVAWQGHMPMSYIGKGTEDQGWAIQAEFHPFLDSQVKAFEEKVPDGAFVLSLGYHGLDPIQRDTWIRNRHRVIHLSGDHPDPEWQPDRGVQKTIDLGYAFGDSCVSVDDYPICLFAPSGIAQLAAYQAILAELAPMRR